MNSHFTNDIFKIDCNVKKFIFSQKSDFINHRSKNFKTLRLLKNCWTKRLKFLQHARNWLYSWRSMIFVNPLENVAVWIALFWSATRWRNKSLNGSPGEDKGYIFGRSVKISAISRTGTERSFFLYRLAKFQKISSGHWIAFTCTIFRHSKIAY